MKILYHEYLLPNPIRHYLMALTDREFFIDILENNITGIKYHPLEKYYKDILLIIENTQIKDTDDDALKYINGVNDLIELDNCLSTIMMNAIIRQLNMYYSDRNNDILRIKTEIENSADDDLPLIKELRQIVKIYEITPKLPKFGTSVKDLWDLECETPLFEFTNTITKRLVFLDSLPYDLEIITLIKILTFYLFASKKITDKYGHSNTKLPFCPLIICNTIIYLVDTYNKIYGVIYDYQESIKDYLDFLSKYAENYKKEIEYNVKECENSESIIKLFDMGGITYNVHKNGTWKNLLNAVYTKENKSILYLSKVVFKNIKESDDAALNSFEFIPKTLHDFIFELNKMHDASTKGISGNQGLYYLDTSEKTKTQILKRVKESWCPINSYQYDNFFDFNIGKKLHSKNIQEIIVARFLHTFICDIYILKNDTLNNESRPTIETNLYFNYLQLITFIHSLDECGIKIECFVKKLMLGIIGLKYRRNLIPKMPYQKTVLKEEYSLDDINNYSFIRETIDKIFGAANENIQNMSKDSMFNHYENTVKYVAKGLMLNTMNFEYIFFFYRGFVNLRKRQSKNVEDCTFLTDLVKEIFKLFPDKKHEFYNLFVEKLTLSNLDAKTLQKTKTNRDLFMQHIELYSFFTVLANLEDSLDNTKDDYDGFLESVFYNVDLNKRFRHTNILNKAAYMVTGGPIHGDISMKDDIMNASSYARNVIDSAREIIL